MEIGGIGIDVRVEDVAIGVVVGRGGSVGEGSGRVTGMVEAAVVAASADGGPNKGIVRDMLRFGRYKPTGRGKPASEYLLKAALDGRFPRVNNIVDVLNVVSLKYMLPISLIDMELAGSDRFCVRRGREGESYVFNAAGQTIDLRDLLLVSALPDDRPCGNPVKDSLATKLVDASRDVIGIIYGPGSLSEAVGSAAEALARGIEREGAARSVAHAVVAHTAGEAPIRPPTV